MKKFKTKKAEQLFKSVQFHRGPTPDEQRATVKEFFQKKSKPVSKEEQDRFFWQIDKQMEELNAIPKN